MEDQPVKKIVDFDLEKVTKDNQENFSRRLQKSKIKDLERDLRVAGDQKQFEKLTDILKATKKQVFTDERKLEQRKAGFQRAKTNVKKTFMNEFAM